MKNRKYKRCLSDRVFDVCNYAIMIFLLIVVFYPLYYIVIVSFSKTQVGTYLWPGEVSLLGYRELFRFGDIWTGYLNTIIYTVGGVLVSLFCTLLYAYAISRHYFVGRGFFVVFVMIPMFFNGGLIPTYLTVNQLGLVDTRFYIIISAAASTYNIIVARTFFKSSIPDELYEASVLDGCGDGKFFLAVVLPLSKSIIAVEALYYGVAQWNSYMTEMIYLRDRDKLPLSVVLKQVLWSVEAIRSQLSGEQTGSSFEMLSGEALKLLEQRAETASVMQYCIIVVSCIPMLIVFPYVQKYFAKGVMLGSVKG